MINFIKTKLSKLRTGWRKLSEVPGEGFLGPVRTAGAIASPEQALTLSPYWAGIRRYQTALARMPLVVYRRAADGGRERARTHPAYRLLHERPNPAMSRSVFMRKLVWDVYQEGEFFALIRWRANGAPMGLYPIPAADVLEVYVDEEWNKAYAVRTPDGVEVYPDSDVIHLFRFSDDGIRGKRLIDYAAESLGLHRQVLESANSLYANAARPSGYIKYAGKLDPQAIQSLKTDFKAEYQGTSNTGSIPVLQNGGEFTTFGGQTAEDAQIIEALGASVGDIARWMDLSPLLLGDYSAAHYGSLAADNQSAYQRSVAPFADEVELEFNAKLFGVEGEFYCEFLVEALLRGDPVQQAEVDTKYIQAGVYLRSEVRERLNLPPIDGLDVPLHPLNMGPEMATPDTPPAEAPTTPNTEVSSVPNPNQ